MSSMPGFLVVCRSLPTVLDITCRAAWYTIYYFSKFVVFLRCISKRLCIWKTKQLDAKFELEQTCIESFKMSL